MVSGAALIGCCYGFGRFAYGLFVPTFAAHFQLSPTAVGAIGAGSYIGYGAAIITALFTTDRFGPHRIAVLAGAVATVGLTAIAAAPSAWVLAVGIVIAGSSTGLVSPPMAAAVARRLRGPAADRAQTIVNAGTGLGVVVSGPVAHLLTDQWRMAWAVYAVVAASVTGWVARTLRTETRDQRCRTEFGGRLRPGSGALLAAAALAGVGSIAVWNFGRDVIGQSHAGNFATAAWIVLGAAGIAGAFGGALVHRLGFRTAWVAVIGAMAGATVLVATATRHPATVLLAVGGFGAAYIAMTGLLLVWSTRVYPESAASGVGLAFLSLAVGQAVGAPLTGVLTESFGSPAAFATTAAISCLALLLRPTSSPRRERDRREYWRNARVRF